MPDPIVIAIAAGFGLIGLLPLARRALTRPALWVCLLAGVGITWVAQEGAQWAWDWVGVIGGLYKGPAEPFAKWLVIAAVGELVKATVPLIVVMSAPANAVTGLAYGAAAGAGYGVVATLLDSRLADTVRLMGSAITSPLSTGFAIFLYLFPILAHIATTGAVVRAAVRGGFGSALLLAWVVQFLVGLVEFEVEFPVIMGAPTGRLVVAIIALTVYGYLWRARVRAESGSAPSVGGP
ncbi:MAG: hypothetical protein HY355_04235 [Armatimonadetes bacterium]|nr:hypothetical protein [Armatimonadota bacterium]